MGPTEEGGGERTSARPPTLAGPVFVCDASAEAERLITSLRNRGYQTVDVPLGMLPSRVRYEVPSLVVCDADAHEALARVREAREATSESVRVLFVGHDDGALRREPGFVDVATATLTRPLKSAATLELIERIIGPAPHTPTTRKGQRRLRAPVLVASARKPFRSDSGFSAHPPSLGPEPYDPLWPVSSPGNLGPLPLDLGDRGTPSSSAAPVPSITPSSIPPSSERGDLSAETQAILAEGRRKLALRSSHAAPHHPAQTYNQTEAVSAELLDVLRAPLDADDHFVDHSRVPAPRHSSASAVGSDPPELARRAASERAERHPSTPELPPGVVRPTAHDTEAKRAEASRASDEAVVSYEPESEVGPSDREEEAPITVPPPRLTRTRDSELPSSSEELTNPGGRPGSRPAVIDDPGSSLPPPTFLPPPSQLPDPIDVVVTDLGSARPRRSIESIAARPVFSTPPPLDDLSDLLQTTSSMRPAPLSPLPPASEASLPSFAALAPRPHTIDVPTPGGSASREAFRVPAIMEPIRQPSLLPPGPQVDGEWSPRRTISGLALAIRQRISGALAQQAEGGVRRILLRDGDVLNVTSSSEADALPRFLFERGDIDMDTLVGLSTIPRFGRHAGAALIAQGYLQQEDLWPALRAHAEWLLGKMLRSEDLVHLETAVPARIGEEPAVFGGAAGAEIYVDSLRRVLDADIAKRALGTGTRIVGQGAGHGLVSEVGLEPDVEERAMRAVGKNVDDLYESDREVLVVVFALVELGVLSVGTTPVTEKPPENVDLSSARIDHAAFAAKLRARRALVEDGDYFSILGVARSATTYEIERAQRELVAELSGERSLGDPALRSDAELVLRVIEEAYLVLRDEARRTRYRRALEA